MLIAIWPLVFAVLGLLLWVFASHPKLVEVGRLVFFAGLFWLVYVLSGRTLRL